VFEFGFQNLARPSSGNVTSRNVIITAQIL
jgi:hypothetical protein